MTRKPLNIPILEEVAQWLESGAPHTQQHPFSFDMSYFYRETDCGSAACIAGAVVQFANKVDLSTLTQVDILAQARNIINLTYQEADELFAPADESDQLNEYEVQHESISPQWAARTIRHLIATGNIDWPLNTDIELSYDYV